MLIKPEAKKERRFVLFLCMTNIRSLYCTVRVRVGIVVCSCVCLYLWFNFPGAEDVGKKDPPLERTSSISEEYMRYLNNPENEEKRFPVDRKKLERLIVGESVRGHVTCSQGRLTAVCYIRSTYQ